MKLISKSKYITEIQFPEYKGRQKYMITTSGSKVNLGDEFEVYDEQVQNLCNELNYKGTIHVTIDEKELKAGETQRKPLPHVDGRFMNGGWGHTGGGGWNHYCNELPIKRMAIAVASSVARCKVFHGIFKGVPSEQGDCSHLSDQLGKGEIVPKNQWHLLSPDCVHESMPMEKDCERSFIRVAFENQPIAI